MEKICVVLFFFCALVAAGAPSPPPPPSPLPTLDVSGFSWAENQAFDNNENLFVTDTTQGIIYRVFLESSQNKYVKTTHASGFSSVNGIVFNSEENVLYAAVTLAGSPLLIGLDPLTPNYYYNISQMKAQGNGLAWDPLRGAVYSTNEGKFDPGRGFIMQIIPAKNTSSIIVDTLDSADGCQILDANYMYISEVVTATLRVFDISNDEKLTQICTFQAPSGVESIDDFTFSVDGSLIYAADYRNGTVVSFPNQCNQIHSSSSPPPPSSSSLTYIMTGLLNPTSAYFAPHNSEQFTTNSLFVSEGGSIISTLHNRHVLQSPAVV